MLRWVRFAAFLILPVVIPGCNDAQTPSGVQRFYYLNPHKTLNTLGRVAIVELDNESSYAQISTDVTEMLFQALQKKQVFGLSIVRRHDPSWRSLQLEGDSTYDLNQILTIRKTLKCDGVLLGTVTDFRPYPHMSIGLRLKLLDLKDGQLVWALEQVWDGADKTTEKRAKSYFRSEKATGHGPSPEPLLTVSPLEFVKFVSYEVAQTL
ncbi:MAG: hypothetical protein P8Z79_01075 [Sedimentisphaerales bacterium]